MNEKGEVTLLGIFILVTLTGVLILCQLELRNSFRLLQKRTNLFLCVKETKGELNEYLKFMGQTNWAIKNINKAKLVMLVIPGLQGASFNTEKARKLIMHLQNLRLVSYLKTLSSLKSKGCPIDPIMPITPFKISLTSYQRDMHGAAILRKEEWTYYYSHGPYVLTLKTNTQGYLNLSPKIKFQTKELEVKSRLTSLSSF